MERQVTYVALFAAFIAVLGLIPRVDLAGGIPFTLQNLGIMLAGSVLGAKRGTLAVILFLVLVAIGLPLLPGGRGGLGVFAGPTAGFLFGFPLVALVTGLIVEKWRNVNLFLVTVIGCVVGGLIVLYPLGIVVFSQVAGMPIDKVVAIMSVYLIGDAIKIPVVAFLTQAIARARPSALLSRA